jgi:hypothetical protein
MHCDDVFKDFKKLRVAYSYEKQGEIKNAQAQLSKGCGPLNLSSILFRIINILYTVYVCEEIKFLLGIIILCECSFLIFKSAICKLKDL